MKYLALIIFGFLTCEGFSQDLMEDKNADKTHAANSIQGNIEEPLNQKASKSLFDSKVLYLLDYNPITEEEVKKINPDDIKTITVIKDKKSMSQYTADNYDGIIVIEMKKP